MSVETFTCPECGRSITRTPDGTEAGHQRGAGGSGSTARCPRRPPSVDPTGMHTAAIKRGEGA